ncbi:dihydroorotase [Thermoanaerobacterium thermosaccharolyticum]|uniref:Dihydroorotase n=2 Tax=Thermoanaerobacterium thermosaccharolyticum TaxID=1517 RepID=D9TNT4_THETC|nr:dihydroorotase [Thermoanaerobacterium thermosaccharolyticum]ADL69053.1 dihydroorotase, multifunctional complex type [Thermoanaerobacterium thermosaccharolyticum DSM 571]AST58902.1 dihydroorotase [Thermoanaerobacterium thermosaccharolyticum]KAA5807117.1 dihydroorotase [Thermoanaerobacterium thermosaccharolyticum]OXT06390.1 dihydroorotase [Thermoanaerobacterium thermosaccharolyticum]PHO06960.1 dihydroorotase [Thermoanaerobacterium thermosaccharolyticum]
MKTIIKGGTVINGYGTNEKADILVDNGKIKAIEKTIELNDALIIDANGKYVLPGFVDMHTHLRQPGFEEKETIKTGTHAAVAGGFTTVACMPNTNPVIDNEVVVEYIKSIAKRDGYSKVIPIGSMTKGMMGEEISEMAKLKDAGIVALSDDGHPIMNAGLMKRIMTYGSMYDLLMITHCEDKMLSGEGVMNNGLISTMIGLRGIPHEAEEVMVARNIILAKSTGARLHIAHVSTKDSVELIRRAKADGVNVTAEVTPHNLCLTEDIVDGFDTNTKAYPPLRTKEDVDALIDGLKDGTIDVIATDHAPHTKDDKKVPYEIAAFGISGIEIAFSVIYTYLVKNGLITLEDLVSFMSINPAKLLKTSYGIKVGNAADITVVDTNKEYTVNVDNFKSKGKNSPFNGKRLTGVVEYTLVDGKIIYKNNGKFEECNV